MVPWGRMSSAQCAAVAMRVRVIVISSGAVVRLPANGHARPAVRSRLKATRHAVCYCDARQSCVERRTMHSGAFTVSGAGGRAKLFDVRLYGRGDATACALLPRIHRSPR